MTNSKLRQDFFDTVNALYAQAKQLEAATADIKSGINDVANACAAELQAEAEADGDVIREFAVIAQIDHAPDLVRDAQ